MGQIFGVGLDLRAGFLFWAIQSAAWSDHQQIRKQCDRCHVPGLGAECHECRCPGSLWNQRDLGSHRFIRDDEG